MGLAKGLAIPALSNPKAGVQLYVSAPFACNWTFSPSQIMASSLTDSSGTELTVIVATPSLVQLKPLVTVTA